MIVYSQEAKPLAEKAINKLVEAGYKIGILIAPVILVENWKH